MNGPTPLLPQPAGAERAREGGDGGGPGAVLLGWLTRSMDSDAEKGGGGRRMAVYVSGLMEARCWC